MNIQDSYFEWISEFTSSNHRRPRKEAYSKLLHYLNDRDFEYSIGMDGNRAADGIDLRYRFAKEEGYDYRIVANELDNRPCSVLEMMVALSIRCEEHIMEDSDIGNRTSKWFWDMVKSLGLFGMTDDRFNFQYVEEVVTMFLRREYKKNGEGGLFTVEHNRYDMRAIEIWYQMCLYLETII